MNLARGTGSSHEKGVKASNRGPSLNMERA